MTTIYDIDVITSQGTPQSLADYRGKVLLIVNVASRCGLTPQYEGLESLYREYKEKGFEILGFPCNQFGAQEPGDMKAIQEFCTLQYDVTFPLFSKIDVNGPQASPLYQHLKASAPGFLGTEAIKWNFTKFLIGRNGKVLERFAPTTTPEQMRTAIEDALRS